MWAVALACVVHVLSMFQIAHGRGGSFLPNFLDLVDLFLLITVPGWIVTGFLERKERLKVAQSNADA
jgi:hypothetical protein